MNIEQALKEHGIIPGCRDTLRVLLTDIDWVTHRGSEISRRDLGERSRAGSTRVVRNYISRMRIFLNRNDFGNIVSVSDPFSDGLIHQFRFSSKQINNVRKLRDHLGLTNEDPKFEPGEKVVITAPGIQRTSGVIVGEHVQYLAVKFESPVAISRFYLKLKEKPKPERIWRNR